MGSRCLSTMKTATLFLLLSVLFLLPSPSSQYVTSCIVCDTTGTTGTTGMDEDCVNADPFFRQECSSYRNDGCMAYILQSFEGSELIRDCCKKPTHGEINVHGTCQSGQGHVEYHIDDNYDMKVHIQSCGTNNCNTMDPRNTFDTTTDPRNGALPMVSPLISVTFILLFFLAIV